MGEVYRARDTRLGRQVAVKVLLENVAKDLDLLRRFEREAKALAALSHPNILTIHDFGADQDLTYVVTELLDGETLRSRIQKSPLNWKTAVSIGISIADGLSEAHSKGQVHRDLKPENIFVTSTGQVKILDFGLVQWKTAGLGDVDASLETISALKTKSGALMGTVPYMSPEQLREEKVDYRSDLFSYGCILHEMLTGKRVFSRHSGAETISAILQEPAPSVLDFRSDVPDELDELILHCLEKNPANRFQSASDIAFALHQLLSRSGTSRTAGDHISFRYGGRKRLLRFSQILTVALLVLSIFLLYRFNRSSQVHSIAILPFDNSTQSEDMEYLSDGLAESIINRLTAVPKLRVVAFSTVQAYKGREFDPKEAGQRLKVDTILTGRIFLQDEQLIIRTSLVRASDGSGLWGKEYVQGVTDLLQVQNEIAASITDNLKVDLTGEERERLAKRQTTSVEAYRLYLKGRYYWNKRNAEGVKKGIGYFREAIEQDPTYALGYAGLADCYAVLGVYHAMEEEEAFSKAEAAAKQALSLDDQLAEAYASLGLIKMNYWKWSEAEMAFRRAIDLKPGYATARHWFANYLQVTGRQEEALREIKVAIDLDPLSLIINELLGWHLYLSRRYDEAIQQLQKTLEMDQNFVPARLALGMTYVQKRNYDQAIVQLRKSADLTHQGVDYVSRLGYAYAISGNRSEALRILRELQSETGKPVSPLHFAIIHVGLGNREEAFLQLNKAVEEHSEFVTFLQVEPLFDPLRSDPRFDHLLKEIGLKN